MGSKQSSLVSSDEPSDESQYREALASMENGDDSAKTTVAFFKLSGRGGAEIDEEGAVELLEERANQNDGKAMWMLGLCCEFGIGTESDQFSRALPLYQQSELLGNRIGRLLMLVNYGVVGARPAVGAMNLREDWNCLLFCRSF